MNLGRAVMARTTNSMLGNYESDLEWSTVEVEDVDRVAVRVEDWSSVMPCWPWDQPLTSTSQRSSIHAAPGSAPSGMRSKTGVASVAASVSSRAQMNAFTRSVAHASDIPTSA